MSAVQLIGTIARQVTCGGLIWLGLAASAWADTTTVEYIHTDALGSPVAVTDASGAVIPSQSQVYEPYGAPISHGPTDGPGFTGHVEDSATGLTYMQQRYYDPSLGRFLSADPVLPISDATKFWPRYRYGSGNPLGFADPDGRADVNYFNSSDGLYEAASRFDIPGMTTVMGHSWSTGYRDDRDRKPGLPVSYESLKDEISRSRSVTGDAGYIFLGGCNLGYREVPEKLAKDFNVKAISAPGYVRRSTSPNGDITYTTNSRLDGSGAARWFQLTAPDGKTSGRIGSVTQHSDGKISFTPYRAEAPTGSNIKR